MRPHHRSITAALAIALALTGCAGDDTATTGATSPVAPAAAPTLPATAPATSGPPASATAPATTSSPATSSPATSPAPPAPQPATPVDCPAGAPAAFECFTVTVPADHAEPAGPTIDLAVTVNRRDAAAWDLPVLRGTGLGHQIYWDTPPTPSAAFDSVWIDRRGFGRSTPLPPCDGIDGWNVQFQTGNFTDTVADALRDCVATAVADVPWLASIQDDRVDALDTIAVREALGIDTWAIATTNAFANTVLHLVDLEPDRIRGIIAIEPVAGDAGGGTADVQHGFEAYARACALRPACSAHGDIAENLQLALERFGDGIEVESSNPGGPPVVIDANDLLLGVRSALWEPTLAAILGQLAAGAADGSADAVIAGYLETRPYVQPPGPTAHTVIEACNDPDWTDPAAADPSNPFGAATWRDRCLVAGLLEPVVHDPPKLSSDVPVLVVMGGMNSLSSVGVAREVFDGFSNVVIAESPGIVEPPAELTDCYVAVRDAFVTDPTADIDTTCLTEPATQTIP